MTYKKICVMCKKEFIPNSNVQKYCEECRKIAHSKYKRKYYLTHLDLVKQRAKKYNLIHPELKKQWRLKHSEYIKEYQRQYHIEHSEYLKEYSRQYHKKHVESHRKEAREWGLNNPEKRKKISKKNNFKRRSLGYIPLNSYKSYEEGYVFHHLNEIGYGIYMLEKDHRSIYHNHFTGQGMDKINTLAVQWYMTQVMKETHKYLI